MQGGLPSSEAAKTFPKSHVWIDQSPQNFSGAAEDIFVSKIKKKAEKKKKTAYAPIRSILESSSHILGPIVSLASSLVLPSFDVIENLQKNHGAQIYTIGVPNADGSGGDELVPISHRDAIRTFLSSHANGTYLPMMGATHVTDWWLDSITYQTAHTILDKTNLSKNLFPPRDEQTNKQLIEKNYKRLIPKLRRSTSKVKTENSLHNLLECTISGEIDIVSKELKFLKRHYSPKDMLEIYKSCLDIAKQTKNKEMTLFFIQKIQPTNK